MKQEERAILVWSVFFVVSGVVFITAFMFSPLVGTLITFAYILLYVGLSAAFMIVFRELENIRKDTKDELLERKEELEDIEKALKGKFFSKKISPDSFRKIMEEYEKKLTEIEVKLKRLEKK